MTGENGQEKTALLRRVAELEISSTLEARNRLLDENSAASRWLLASLLAVNGGSALALLSFSGVTKMGVVLGGAIFSAGVFCALLLAYFTQRSTRAMIEPLGKITAFWVKVLQSGSFDEAVFDAQKQELQKCLKPMKRASSISGWISAFCFLGGVIAIGTHLK